MDNFFLGSRSFDIEYGKDLHYWLGGYSYN